MQKVDGVTAAKVTLKDGHARLTLKPGNTVTLAEIRRLVERSGFTPQGATVVAEVEEVAAAAQPTLRISGTTETFPLSASTSERVRTDLQKQAGKRVLVDAVVPAAKDNPAGAIVVQGIKPTRK